MTRAADQLWAGRDQAYLESLVAEVEENVLGKRVTAEGEDDEPGSETDKDA